MAYGSGNSTWQDFPSKNTPVNAKRLNAIETFADKLKNRIDNIVSSAGDSNTEIVDARVTADGTQYDTLKGRLDADTEKLKSNFDEFNAKVGTNFDASYTYSLGDINIGSSEITKTKAFAITSPIDINNGLQLIVKNNSNVNIVFNPMICYADGTARFNGNSVTVNIGESYVYTPNAAYDKIRFRVRTTPSSNMEQTTVDSIMNGVTFRFKDLYEKFYTDRMGNIYKTLIDKINAIDGFVIAIHEPVDANILLSQTLQEKQGDNLCFILQSDTHYKHDNQDNRSGIKSIANISNYLMCDFIANLGDSIRGNENDNYEASLNDMSYLMYDYLNSKNKNIPLFMVKGNHEDGSLFVYRSNENNGTSYGLSQLITDDKLFAKEFNQMRSLPTYPINIDNPMYYYFDIKGYRVIILNAVDVIVTETNGKMDYYGGWNDHCYGYSQDQLDWFGNVALKTEREVIVFTHIPLISELSSEYGDNSDIVINILNAFINGTSYHGVNTTIYPSYNNFTCDVSVDFAEQGNGRIVGVWCGHTHLDQRVDKDAANNILFPHINIKNGCENGKFYIIGDTILEIDLANQTETREFVY